MLELEDIVRSEKSRISDFSKTQHPVSCLIFPTLSVNPEREQRCMKCTFVVQAVPDRKDRTTTRQPGGPAVL